jgi:hypothetical protein
MVEWLYRSTLEVIHNHAADSALQRSRVSAALARRIDKFHEEEKPEHWLK